MIKQINDRNDERKNSIENLSLIFHELKSRTNILFLTLLVLALASCITIQRGNYLQIEKSSSNYIKGNYAGSIYINIGHGQTNFHHFYPQLIDNSSLVIADDVRLQRILKRIDTHGTIVSYLVDSYTFDGLKSNNTCNSNVRILLLSKLSNSNLLSIYHVCSVDNIVLEHVFETHCTKIIAVKKTSKSVSPVVYMQDNTKVCTYDISGKLQQTIDFKYPAILNTSYEGNYERLLYPFAFVNGTIYQYDVDQPYIKQIHKYKFPYSSGTFRFTNTLLVTLMTTLNNVAFYNEKSLILLNYLKASDIINIDGIKEIHENIYCIAKNGIYKLYQENELRPTLIYKDNTNSIECIGGVNVSGYSQVYFCQRENGKYFIIKLEEQGELVRVSKSIPLDKKIRFMLIGDAIDDKSQKHSGVRCFFSEDKVYISNQFTQQD